MNNKLKRGLKLYVILVVACFGIAIMALACYGFWCIHPMMLLAAAIAASAFIAHMVTDDSDE
jgi:hypothetical protein